MINHLKWNIQIKNLTLSDGIFHQWQKDKHKAGYWPNINGFCVRDFWHISVESLSPCRNSQKRQNTARDTSRSWVNLFTSLKTISGFKCHFRFNWNSVSTLPWSRMKPRRRWHRSMKGWTCEWNNKKCVFWESEILPNNWMNPLRIHVSIQVWQEIPKVWKLEAQFLHLYQFESHHAIWFSTKLRF